MIHAKLIPEIIDTARLYAPHANTRTYQALMIMINFKISIILIKNHNVNMRCKKKQTKDKHSVLFIIISVYLDEFVTL